MLKIKFILSTLLMLSFVAGGTVLANPENPQVEADSPPYLSYLPLIFTPPPPAPPDYYSTSWYVTTNMATSYKGMYNKGLQAGALTLPPGRQDQLIILHFGQPWIDGNQYGTLLYNDEGYDLASTGDIAHYTKQFITGFMAGSDGESILELGIGTSNYAKYKDGVCTERSTFCNTSVAYNHGKAWAIMVKEVYTWVIQQGYANRVTVAGANDIELAWNYASITHAWANGFNDYNNTASGSDMVIYYNFGACDGCDGNINIAVPPNPDKYIKFGWTHRKVHYTAWGVSPAWPIPEIYSNNGVLANQWANLSKVGVDIGFSKMYFLSAMTQMQACDGSNDPQCPTLDNTPVEGWYQLHTAINKRPETSQHTIPYMTDIERPN